MNKNYNNMESLALVHNRRIGHDKFIEEFEFEILYMERFNIYVCEFNKGNSYIRIFEDYSVDACIDDDYAMCLLLNLLKLGWLVIE